MAAYSKEDMMDLLETASLGKHTNSLDHLGSCLHVLSNYNEITTFTYRFFQELNSSCMKLLTELGEKNPNSSSICMIENMIFMTSSTTNDPHINVFESISLELFKILHSKSKLNLNIMKMVSKSFVSSMQLYHSKTAIIFLFQELFQLDDSVASSRFKLEHVSIAQLKIMIAAGICEQDRFWSTPDFPHVVDLVISSLCAYCTNKYARYLVFSLQTLGILLGDVVKKSHLVKPSLQNEIFSVILGNWENYLPSVMDETLLLCVSFVKCFKQQGEEMFQLEKFWNFLTNVSCAHKSKYYMIAACLLANFYGKDLLIPDTWLVKNMVYSLSRSYLVTAGAYCHKVLVKNILTEDHWKEVFLKQVIHLVCDKDISIRQNVANYWLPTALKQYPGLYQVLYTEILSRYHSALSTCQQQLERHYKNRDIDHHQRYLHAVILIIKLKRPLRFSNNEKYELVRQGLVCSNEIIRGDAFLCCQTFYGAKSHVFMERGGVAGESCQFFSDVFSFLEQNVNCDDSTLRQTMYKVFKNYVVNIECQFKSCAIPLDLTIKENGTLKPYRLPHFMVIYIEQCTQLYEFFFDNLCSGANYQRLITTLNLVNILLENIEYPMTQNQKKKRMSMKEYLRRTGVWKFESAALRDRVLYCLKEDTMDVRQMAKHLLVTYFRFTNDEASAFRDSLTDSLEMSRSSVFYKAESGAYIVAVLANLYYKSELNIPLEKIFKMKESNGKRASGVDRVCDSMVTLEIETINERRGDNTSNRHLFSTYYLRQCQLQSQYLQSDLLLAVKNYNSLHGALNTLMLLLTDPTSPEFCALEVPQVESLLLLLNETCLYLLDILCMKSKSTNFAPSFGEMGEAMMTLIEKTWEADDMEQLTMSPAHQAVFNCIWSNLRVCCALATEVTVAYAGRLSRDQVVFSCGIVSQVLHKCRHKGAIQNAGLALVSIVSKCLYHDGYPLELLQSTMSAVFQCQPGGTVSRKSAGVAILVHKIVSSNHSMKQELFTVAMERILEVATSHVEESDETLKIDLPQAIAFHMLQFLVADSSMRVLMAPHLERITIACFDKMQCTEWTVRNAALQVFGVLLPKLVGTKKQDNEQQSSNVAFEEFFFQFPRIGDTLRSLFTAEDAPSSSFLVAVLTLLSRLRVTGDLMQMDDDMAALKLFLSKTYSRLMRHRVHTLRTLTANCYVNTFHEHEAMVSYFEILLFTCLEYMVGDERLKTFSTPNMKYFLRIDSRKRITDEGLLNGTLHVLMVLKYRLSLENLKLDDLLVTEVLNLLSEKNPLCILVRSVSHATYAMLFTLFRDENRTRGPRLSGFNFFITLSDAQFRKQIGSKALLQEVWMFHMPIFNLDYRDLVYIENTATSTREDSDVLNKIIAFMVQQLVETSASDRVFVELDSFYNGERKDVTAAANLCIGNILCFFSDNICEGNRKFMYQVFRLVLQVYSMYVDDSRIDKVSGNVNDFLEIGQNLYSQHWLLPNDHVFQPALIPTLAICLAFSEGEKCKTYCEIDVAGIQTIINSFLQDRNLDISNEDVRVAKALALPILYRNAEYNKKHIQHLLVLAMDYFQDEVSDVRQEVLYFMRESARFEFDSDCQVPCLLKNPYCCLLEMTTKYTRLTFASQLIILCRQLFVSDEDVLPLKAETELSNPFDHNIRNFYSEPLFLTRYISRRIATLLIGLETQNIVRSSLESDMVTLTNHLKLFNRNTLNNVGKMKVDMLEKILKALENKINGEGLVKVNFTQYW